MQQRFNALEKGPDAFKTLYGTGTYLSKSPIEQSLQELICVHISQINNCAFCIDMHYKQARAKGESEKRLYGLSAWRLTSWYDDRERAAFALAEAITDCNVPDAVFNEAAKHFSEIELIDLTLVVTSINSWNRINHAFASYAV